MIEMIYDVEDLEGSDYIEVLPGKFKRTHWNDSSIFFSEESFGYIRPAIENCHRAFYYFGPNEIRTETWKKIIDDLETMKQYLIGNPEPHSLREVIGFPYADSYQQFVADYATNKAQLISMITEFQKWIEQESVSIKFITILGL